MLNTDDIKKLASLSRIHMDEAEIESITKDVDSILGYVTEIQQVASDKEVILEPVVKNVMREDVVTTETGSNTDTLIQAAPKKLGNEVMVKKILG